MRAIEKKPSGTGRRFPGLHPLNAADCATNGTSLCLNGRRINGAADFDLWLALSGGPGARPARRRDHESGLGRGPAVAGRERGAGTVIQIDGATHKKGLR